jgi:histone-lysine N-methyltransferase SETD3
MDEAEMSDATSLTLAVSGASVSAKNDARTKAVLLKSLASFLESYTTTLAEDNEYVARVDDESNDEPLPGKRKRFAVLLRMREKQILLASADALFKELPDEDQELVKSTCEEIFMNEFDACMTRANGTVFASYEKKTEEERVDESS